MTTRVRSTTLWISTDATPDVHPGRFSAPGILLALLTFAGMPAHAAPFIPTGDDVVLERLPARDGPLWAEARQRRDQLAASPQDVDTASALALIYLKLQRASGDPRLLGYAEAALKPWWSLAEPPLPAALLRAQLRQTLHEFPAAETELQLLVRREPGSAQAWLQLATVEQVLGKHREARTACARLALTADPVLAGTCLAASNGATGQAESALGYLERALGHPQELPPGISVWMETIAGELATGLGRRADAERYFRQAILGATQESGHPDLYLLTAYADLLLDQRRDPEVVSLLGNLTAADTTLLRLARAEERLGMASGPAHVAELAARLKALLDRGDQGHGREQAYFALYLLDDPRLALPMASQNWLKQRELIDSRLLLEAATRAGDTAAARRVRDWLTATGTRDVRLGVASS